MWHPRSVGVQVAGGGPETQWRAGHGGLRSGPVHHCRLCCEVLLLSQLVPAGEVRHHTPRTAARHACMVRLLPLLMPWSDWLYSLYGLHVCSQVGGCCSVGTCGRVVPWLAKRTHELLGRILREQMGKCWAVWGWILTKSTK